MKKLTLLFVVLSLWHVAPAWSEFAKTAEEKKLCDTMNIVNHECDCVRFVNRALAVMKDKAAFNYNLGEAIGGCNYHLSHSPGSPWNATAYYQIGLAQQLQKKPTDAITALYKALQLNPKLEQAYSELANVFMSLKNKDNALKIVGEGLRWLPDSKTLQRKYTKYGGVLPFPTPHEQAAPPTPAKAPPVANVEQVPRTSLEQSAAARPENSNTEANSRRDDVPPVAIGSSTNPWCRFCPDTPAAPPAPSPSTPGAIPTIPR